MYHYIKHFDKSKPYFNFLHLNDFKKQINYLSKKDSFIKIIDTLEENYHKNKFLLTFDDGLKEHLNIARYLKKKNILGIFFIPTMQIEKVDFLPVHKIHLIFGKYNSAELENIFKKYKIHINYGKKLFTLFQKQKKFLEKKNFTSENDNKIYLKTLLNNLDQKNKHIVKKIFNFSFSEKEQKKIFKKFYLNSNDIIELDKLGMKIGSHGYNHRVLSTLNYNQQKNDICRSTRTLSKILKKEIDYFCYPYGGFKVFNRHTMRILRKEKITYSFNVESKDWLKKSNRLYIPRYDCNEFKHGKLFKKN